MNCENCKDLRILRKDDQPVSGDYSVRELMRLHYPCPYCEAGREEAKLWLQLRAEFSKPIVDRNGQPLNAGIEL